LFSAMEDTTTTAVGCSLPPTSSMQQSSCFTPSKRRRQQCCPTTLLLIIRAGFSAPPSLLPAACRKRLSEWGGMCGGRGGGGPSASDRTGGACATCTPLSSVCLLFLAHPCAYPKCRRKPAEQSRSGRMSRRCGSGVVGRRRSIDAPATADHRGGKIEHSRLSLLLTLPARCGCSIEHEGSYLVLPGLILSPTPPVFIPHLSNPCASQGADSKV
jgi:hypothetical protein